MGSSWRVSAFHFQCQLAGFIAQYGRSHHAMLQIRHAFALHSRQTKLICEVHLAKFYPFS